jgi:TonB family protein
MLRIALSQPTAASPLLAAAGDAPPLGFRPPESTRSALLSGSIATLLHALLFGFLLLAAWLAPEVIEEKIIPVKLIEAPGSNEVAPKQLAARRPAAAAALAAAARTPTPQQAPRPVASQISAEALRMARLQATRAPRQLDRKQLEARRLDVQKAAQAPRAIDVATLSPVKLKPGQLDAPSVRFSAPQQVEVRSTSDEAFQPRASFDFAQVGESDYTGSAESAGAPVTGPLGLDEGRFAAVGVDAQVSGEYLSGGGEAIGVGGAPQVVACLQSAYVARYMKLVESRTVSRWGVPEGTPDNETVVLNFDLDVSGSVANVKVVNASSAMLGRSAVLALRTASPFPPMDDNVRCLAERRLTGTFSVPQL